MKKKHLLVALAATSASLFAQNDWDGIPVPADPGIGKKWVLDTKISDNFNYDFNSTEPAEFGDDNRWRNAYHNGWTGPGLTQWKRENVIVEDGMLQLITTRVPGERQRYNNGESIGDVTRLGCVSSTSQVVYPLYIEVRARVPNTVNACAAWLLSPDDTQEIDFLEAWGSDHPRNDFFGQFNLSERIHFSHHIFIRNPFLDYQPHEPGTHYGTNPVTIWHEDFHTYGVYWKSPTELFYYLDGELVKTTIGMDGSAETDGIDPRGYTGVELINPNNPRQGAVLDENNNPVINLENRTGLSKPMDIIIDMEDMDWRAIRGATPTDEEIANDPEGHTLKVDWIRLYKPRQEEGFVEVSGISINEETLTLDVDTSEVLSTTITPTDATDKGISWSSNNQVVATVNENGRVSTHSAGTATITVTTDDNFLSDTIEITVIDSNSNKQLTIEAEKFSDTGGTYDGFDTYVTNGIGAINFNQKGDWGDYIVNIENDDEFEISYFIGTPLTQSRIEILVDGVSVSDDAVPSSDWNDFILLKASNKVSLTAGEHTIRLQGAGSNNDDWEWNLEKFILEGTKVLSIEDFTKNNNESLAIIPNPVADNFYISNLKNNNFSFTIYGINGATINKGLINGEQTIDVSNLSNGVYFLTLSDGNSQETLKIIKN